MEPLVWSSTAVQSCSYLKERKNTHTLRCSFSPCLFLLSAATSVWIDLPLSRKSPWSRELFGPRMAGLVPRWCSETLLTIALGFLFFRLKEEGEHWINLNVLLCCFVAALLHQKHFNFSAVPLCSVVEPPSHCECLWIFFYFSLLHSCDKSRDENWNIYIFFKNMKSFFCAF